MWNWKFNYLCSHYVKMVSFYQIWLSNQLMGSSSQGSVASSHLLKSSTGKCKFLDWGKNTPALLGGSQIKVNWHQLKHRKLHLNIINNIFTEWSGTGQASLWDRLWNLHLKSKLNWESSSGTFSPWPCFVVAGTAQFPEAPSSSEFCESNYKLT